MQKFASETIDSCEQQGIDIKPILDIIDMSLLFGNEEESECGIVNVLL